MSDKVLCEMQDLVNIADSVRQVTGSTDKLNVSQLSTRASTIISSGGSISHADWNVNDETDLSYIHNRTHYEASPSFDITWDGVIGDRFALDMSAFGYDGIYFVKVSDRVLTMEEMIGASIIGNESSDPLEHINAEGCDAYHYPGIYDVRSFVIVCYDADTLSSALGLPSGVITNGTYFYSVPESNAFITRFVGRDNSKKLDAKYLPEGYPYETEPQFNIIWNGDMADRTSLDMTALGYEGFYFVKVSDDVFSIEDIVGAKYYYNWNSRNGEREIYEYMIDSDTYPGAYAVSSELVVCYDQDQINSALGLPEGYLTNGIYFVASPNNQMYIARFTGKSEVKKLDGKYMPYPEDMGLATVATSGDYNDLHNRPTVYTDPVRYATYQNLSANHKQIARSNIGVYSQTEVDAKIANLDVNVDLSEYAKTSEVDAKIAEAIGKAIEVSY